jgi:hypothetical protein
MRKATPPLAALVAQLPPLFPATHPLRIRPSADAFAPHIERFSGGHVARWFAALDGQEGQEPFADAHSLCSLEEGLQTVQIADEIRAQPDGYWVEPHWFPISSDGAGQHHMIDDHDGRVLHVAHDDDHVQVVARSPEAWLQELIEGHAGGSLVWDETFGLFDAEQLADVERGRRAAEEHLAAAPKRKAQGLRIGLTIAAAIAILAWGWWLLSRGHDGESPRSPRGQPSYRVR